MTEEDILNIKKELRLLYRVTAAVHSLSLTDVLHEIVLVVDELLAADSILIYLFNSQKKSLILRASKNPHDELIDSITMKLGEGITGWVARHKQAVALPKNASSDPRFKYFHSLPEDRYEAFLSVPILTKHGVIGVINAQHKKSHHYSEMEITLLSAVGKLVGTAVENAQLIEETLELKEALELRKLVEKAKGILMKRKSISEAEAYALMQKESMDRRKSLKDIADAIIITERL